MDVKELLNQTIKLSASDLHIQVGAYPMLRVDGELVPVPGSSILKPVDTKNLVSSLLSSAQKTVYEENKELDFAFNYGNQARFRVNAYMQRGTDAIALRLIPDKIRTIEELGLPDIFYKLASLKSGLVLVVGPTGHGKSSSLAALIDEINKTRSVNIITIEDPVEYIHNNQKAIVSQREVGNDTLSFAAALKSMLREDPDVVLIGEMRDYETISAALTLAETGHLVFATLHTNSASQTIDRVVDVFPAHQQNQIRMQLANSLEAIISQRLLPRIGGGRIPVLEAMLGTTAVRTNIREGKTHLMDNIIQTSSDVGMFTLEKYMAKLVKENKLALDVAQLWALRPADLVRHINSSA